MARLLRMLPSCCPSRTAVLQRALFSSVLNHTKKRVWCQTGLLVPLGVEHGFENGTYYSWCLLFITKRHLYLKLPKTDLKGREESCNHRSSQSDMKVMAEILDFMPGFRCQISPPDTEVLPVISLLGSLQSWGTARRVGERKTSPTPDTQEVPGTRRVGKETRSEQSTAELPSPFRSGQLISPTSGLNQEGMHSISWEWRKETGSEQQN